MMADAPPIGSTSLQGKVALITGASRGIGRAITLGMARAGADVVVSYLRDEVSAHAVADEIAALGRRAVVQKADTSKADEVRGLFEASEIEFGSLDILVNNAGISAATALVDISEAEWDRVINTNLKGYFLCAQAAARLFIRQGKPGRIINLSSARQEEAWPGNAHYCASKGGIYMLSRVMALELGPHGVTVNCLSPGTILTDMNRQKFSEETFLAKRLERIPVGRLGNPEDLAGAAVFLASDQASFINGASLMVDGGQTIW